MRLRIVAVLLVSALIACNSTGSRIRSQQELFDSYPPDVQANLRNGLIEVGYSQEMVQMALGRPERKAERQSEGGLVEVWTYRESVPGFSVGMGSGGYVGSGVAIGTGVSVGESARSEDRAWVEFSEGRVVRFETLGPK